MIYDGLMIALHPSSLSSSSLHPCHPLLFSGNHLRFPSGIISGPGSFVVQFGDSLRSGIICGPRIICGPVQIHVIWEGNMLGRTWQIHVEPLALRI